MASKGAVQVVELFAAGSVDRDGHAQVFTCAAGASLTGGRFKRGVKLLSSRSNGVDKTIDILAHHLDGEGAGIFNQRLLYGGW